jgi:hypothetical protein
MDASRMADIPDQIAAAWAGGYQSIDFFRSFANAALAIWRKKTVGFITCGFRAGPGGVGVSIRKLRKAKS